MAAYRKCVFGSVFDLNRVILRTIHISKCSASTLSRFNTTKENDSFWLRRLDHKDWLAPNEVLKIFMHLRDPQLIIGAFDKASARIDYKPSEALYSLLIDKLARAKKFDAIVPLLEKAKQEKCRLSDDFFHQVIKIYGHVAANQEQAIKTLQRMPEFHCWPTIKTFNCVLNMLVNNKQFDTVHEVFLSAPKLGIALDTCCFNILIKGLCNWNKLDAAFLLLDEITKHRRRPNVTTYSTLMHSLCKQGRVDEAFELCDRMEREKCYPDTVMFNVLISGLCKQRRVREGIELLKGMKLKGCYPNSGSYQALVYGLVESKMFAEAKDFMFMMVSEGFCPSFLSYKLAIEGFCSEKLLEDVDMVLKQMVMHGFVPRMGTWKKIVQCLFHEMDCSYSLSSYIDELVVSLH